jgi:dCMP deaminase
MNKDKKWLEETREKAIRWSKDPSTQVACIIVRPDGTMASQGYNGFPKGWPKRYERGSATHSLINEVWLEKRPLKMAATIHAELNAIIHSYSNLKNCTAYIWPCMPCSSCASALAQAGIIRVVCPNVTTTKGGMDLSLSQQILYLEGIELVTLELDDNA